MKKNIYKIIMIAVCIMTLTTTNVMATTTTGVTTEQGKPKSHKLKTTRVKLKKTSQIQKNQIISQLVAVKGIRKASFSGNTVSISYNPKQISEANVKAYAKSAYNSVVAKKHHQTPQAGRYGNSPQNQPKPQGNTAKPQGNTAKPQGNTVKPQGNTVKPQNNTAKPNNNHSQQPKAGRK